MKFKDFVSSETNESKTFKVTEGTITAVFDNEVDTKEVKKILRSYDTQTWAIDSYVQKKDADRYNQSLLKLLSKMGSGYITYKSGPSNSTKKIIF